jgi:hypothetical protein
MHRCGWCNVIIISLTQFDVHVPVLYLWAELLYQHESLTNWKINHKTSVQKQYTHNSLRDLQCNAVSIHNLRWKMALVKSTIRNWIITQNTRFTLSQIKHAEPQTNLQQEALQFRLSKVLTFTNSLKSEDNRNSYICCENEAELYMYLYNGNFCYDPFKRTFQTSTLARTCCHLAVLIITWLWTEEGKLWSFFSIRYTKYIKWTSNGEVMFISMKFGMGSALKVVRRI